MSQREGRGHGQDSSPVKTQGEGTLIKQLFLAWNLRTVGLGSNFGSDLPWLGDQEVRVPSSCPDLRLRQA